MKLYDRLAFNLFSPFQVCLQDSCDDPLPLFGPGGLLSPSVAVAMSVSACLLLLSVAVLVFVMQASSKLKEQKFL